MKQCCPCYEQIMNPLFSHIEGDCNSTNHDISVVNGGLDGSQSEIISAVLIQLTTDARFNSTRGWWGEEFMGFPIGSSLWSLRDQGITAIRADEMIRDALAPLISQGLFNDLNVDAVKTVDGIQVELEILRENRSLFTVTL